MRALEEQNRLLKAKVEQLRQRLANASTNEGELRGKLSGVGKELKETTAASQGLEEELTRVSL